MATVRPVKVVTRIAAAKADLENANIKFKKVKTFSPSWRVMNVGNATLIVRNLKCILFIYLINLYNAHLGEVIQAFNNVSDNIR